MSKHKKLRRSISNTLHIIILFFISLGLVKINPAIGQKGLFDYQKIIELHLIILGLAVTLITFIYGIIKDLKIKYQNNLKLSPFAPKDIAGVMLSISRNIYRMILSLSIILLLYFTFDLDYPFVNQGIYFTKDLFSAVVRLFSVLYLFLSFLDIIISTIKIYLSDLTDILD